MLAGLHEGLGLGEVLLGLVDAGLQVLHGDLQVLAGLGHGLHQGGGLGHGLLAGPDRQHSGGGVGGVQGLLGLLSGGADELQALPGLGGVVVDLGQRHVRVPVVQVNEFLFGPGHRVRHLVGTGVEGLQGDAGVLLQVAELVELPGVGGERLVDGLAPGDDVLEPGALLLLGVRDVIVQLVLQLVGLAHVVLGGLDVLREGLHRPLAVGGHSEADLLLGGPDRVIGADEHGAGLGAQILDGHLIEGVLRPLRPAGGLTLLLRLGLVAAHQGVAAAGEGGHRHAAGDPAAGPAALTRRGGSGDLAVGGVHDPVHRRERHRLPVVLAHGRQLRGDVLLDDLVLQRIDAVGLVGAIAVIA
ncbi:hypothetical protein ACFFX0_07390 [Citricoccus parietis]|uniref:NAD-specific glutamate dehydrogenase n=1 Tax=Citricoccus parietis TaxID=592307 RepID=A0ABV5FXR7_9MICC